MLSLSKLSPVRLGMHALLVLSLCGSALVAGAVMPADTAEARAGGGRSVGRRSSPPSYRQPSYSQPSPPRAEPGRPVNGYAPPPVVSQPPPPSRGGFLRSAAGGLAGGFLGSMLFNSIGRSNPSGFGGGAAGNGGGGGFGLLELLLFAGVAYVGYRWWRQRQSGGSLVANGPSDNVTPFRMPQEATAPALADASVVPSISAEEASDLFFRIQGAWTRRDLTSVQELLGSEVAAELNRDLQDLKAQRRINRLENISIRHVDVGEAWSEGGSDLAVVRFTANLLDYTVQEGSDQVIAGSDREPVKFNEDWTFARPSGGGRWQLVAIQQV